MRDLRILRKMRKSAVSVKEGSRCADRVGLLCVEGGLR